MAKAIRGHHLTNTHSPGIARESRRAGPALKERFWRRSKRRMEVVHEPDRRKATLLSRLCHTGQRVIRFHRFLDACQYRQKALRKEETIGERHSFSFLSFLSFQKDSCWHAA